MQRLCLHNITAMGITVGTQDTRLLWLSDLGSPLSMRPVMDYRRLAIHCRLLPAALVYGLQWGLKLFEAEKYPRLSTSPVVFEKSSLA